MFRSGWIAAVAFGLVVVGSAALAEPTEEVPVGGEPNTSSQSHKGNDKASEQGTNSHHRSIYITTDSVSIEATIPQLVAVEDGKDADEKRKNEKRDLDAQEAMARWAFWMLVATGASIVVGGVGIYFVWKTLRHATDVSSKQLRAYISVEIENMGDIWDTDYTVPSARAIISNKGQTPARVLVYFGCLDAISKDREVAADVHHYRQNTHASSTTIGPGGLMSVQMDLDDISEELHTKASMDRSHRYVAIGEIRYQDVFGRIHDTQFCFEYRIVKTEKPRPSPNPRGLASYGRDSRTYDWVRFGEYNKAD